MSHYTDLAFIVDTARVSANYKKEHVKMFCEDIIRMFRHRKDQQNFTQYNQTLENVSTDPRLIKYLNDKERIGFVMELNVATQVTTYAHSTHVARLAEAMMKAIIIRPAGTAGRKAGHHQQMAGKASSATAHPLHHPCCTLSRHWQEQHRKRGEQ